MLASSSCCVLSLWTGAGGTREGAGGVVAAPARCAVGVFSRTDTPVSSSTCRSILIGGASSVTPAPFFVDVCRARSVLPAEQTCPNRTARWWYSVVFFFCRRHALLGVGVGRHCLFFNMQRWSEPLDSGGVSMAMCDGVGGI